MKVRFDRELAELVRQQAASVAALREGKMFGCPAWYVGRRLAACVLGDGVAVKLPEGRAKSLIEVGDAEPFSAEGRSMGPHWVVVRPGALDTAPVLAEAAAFVASLA